MKKVAVLAAAAALSLALPAPTLAHKVTERQLFRYEVATLGREHALEHARERRAAHTALSVWNAMTPAKQKALLHREKVARAATASAAPLDQIGEWDQTTIPLPTFAINTVMLPTGEVAFWGREPLIGGKRKNLSHFYVWDPVTGAITLHDPPEVVIDGQTQPAPIFCSGQSLLADGEVFVAGGNLGNPQSLGGRTPLYQGLDTAFTFDPWTLKWTQQPKMEHGRWYPSQVELPDGRIAILAGGDENGHEDDNTQLEVFTPSATPDGVGTMTHYAAGDRLTAFYPHLLTMPGGNVLLGGPTKPDSGLLDLSRLDAPGTGSAWRSFGRLNVDRVGGNAILWPQNAAGDTRMTLLGGYYFNPDGSGNGDATNATETFDLASSGEGWQLNADGIPAMHVARSYGNVVQLPDSTLVAIGGGAGNRINQYGTNFVGFPDNDGKPYNEELKQVELLKPGVDSDWRLGPAQQKFRAYHSTAILLPDGRILSAGDDYWYLKDEERPQGGTPMDVGEIYSPPYLFDGDRPAPRPVINRAPTRVDYGAAFHVAVSGQTPGQAVLVAPGATTHGADMNQRVVDLHTLSATDSGLDVVAPSGGDVAPPGYYMLFVFDKDGTPSVARWVQVGVPAPAATPVTLAPVQTATPVPTTKPAPRRPQLRLARHGRRLQLRLTFHSAGRAALDARLAGRRIRRTLRFKTAGTRVVKLTAPRRPARLTVSVRATAATGQKWTLHNRWRVR